MSSSRLVLIFLALIIVVIFLLTGNRLATALRSRLGNGILGIQLMKPQPSPTPTPSPTPSQGTFPTVPSVTPMTYVPKNPKGSSTQTTQIPATGPEEIAFALIGGSAGIGYLLTKVSSHHS